MKKKLTFTLLILIIAWGLVLTSTGSAHAGLVSALIRICDGNSCWVEDAWVDVNPPDLWC